MDYYFKVVFIIKPEPKWLPEQKDEYIHQFVELRQIAVGALNGCYEEWNNEFSGSDIPDDDPLKDNGGTEYCNYIRGKQKPILDAVNKLFAKDLYLDCDEIADIIGRTNDGHEIEVNLIPID